MAGKMQEAIKEGVGWTVPSVTYGNQNCSLLQ